MPVVTRARVGLVPGTGVAAAEKLRTAATNTAPPTRIRTPAMRRRTPVPGIGKGQDASRSNSRPSRIAPRNRYGGRAMTLAVSVSCGPAASLLMTALHDDNLVVTLPFD